ncbi:MAG: RNA-binding protein [Gammaproteobacteria bacterium]|nr:RNA-binding protein [Gammaproteobacteria bacterium]
MKKMFVSNLPIDASEDSIRKLFSEFGTVRSIQIATDIFTRKCRGFGFVEMEGHEARAAVTGLDGKSYNGKSLRVRFEDPRAKRGGRSGGRKRH